MTSATRSSGQDGHGPAGSGHPRPPEHTHKTRGTGTYPGVAAPPLNGRRSYHGGDAPRRRTAAELDLELQDAINLTKWGIRRSSSPVI